MSDATRKELPPMATIHWDFASDLHVLRIRELQDQNGEFCTDDEVLHTEAGDMALVLANEAGQDQHIIEGTPEELRAFTARLAQLVDDEVDQQALAARDRGEVVP